PARRRDRPDLQLDLRPGDRPDRVARAGRGSGVAVRDDLIGPRTVAAPTVSKKRNVLGVLIDAVDIDAATDIVLDAALQERPMPAAAVAVHPVMMAARDPELRAQVNRIDLIGADGQPVRWGLNLLHGARLRERVYGPELMRRLCAAAERERLPIYLYGSW